MKDPFWCYSEQSASELVSHWNIMFGDKDYHVSIINALFVLLAIELKNDIEVQENLKVLS